jgi:hypothetical protein
MWDPTEPAAQADQRASGPEDAPDPVQRRSAQALVRWPIACSTSARSHACSSRPSLAAPNANLSPALGRRPVVLPLFRTPLRDAPPRLPRLAARCGRFPEVDHPGRRLDEPPRITSMQPGWALGVVAFMRWEATGTTAGRERGHLPVRGGHTRRSSAWIPTPRTTPRPPAGSCRSAPARCRGPARYRQRTRACRHRRSGAPRPGC